MKEEKSPAETGLAISSLTVGVLVAISAIPVGMLLSKESTALTLLPLFAFAVISVVTGFIGRKNAMGVAGLVLGAIAVLETVGVYGYISYEKSQERQKEIAQEIERTKQIKEQTKQKEMELAQKVIEAKTKEAEASLALEERIKAQEKATVENDEKLAREREVNKIRLAEEKKKQDIEDIKNNEKLAREKEANEIRLAEEKKKRDIENARLVAENLENEKVQNKNKLQNILSTHETLLNKYIVLRNEVIQNLENLNKAKENEAGFKRRIQSLEDNRKELGQSQNLYYLNNKSTTTSSAAFIQKRNEIDNEIERNQRALNQARETIQQFYGLKLQVFTIPTQDIKDENKVIDRSQRNSSRSTRREYGNIGNNEYENTGNALFRVHCDLMSLSFQLPDSVGIINLALEKSRPLLVGNSQKTTNSLKTTSSSNSQIINTQKVIVLKDGNEIPVTMIVEMTDSYAIKTIKGETQEIPKKNILEVKIP